MANFESTLAVMLVFAVMTAVAVYLFMKRKQDIMTLKQAKIIIYADVQDICEVALVKKTFNSIVSKDFDKKLPFFDTHIPGTSRKFLMEYSGVIKCGFDFQKVQVVPDDSFGRKIKIFLPKCKILDRYADVDSFKIHCQDAGIFVSNIKIEEQNEWVAADVENQVQIAIQEGLVERADENARQMLWSRISNRGLNNHFNIEIISFDKDCPPAIDSYQQNLLE